jgi:hypothetical protein
MKKTFIIDNPAVICNGVKQMVSAESILLTNNSDSFLRKATQKDGADYFFR